MAAFQEFGTLGYENVNIEKICKVHGISKGMMYHYFSNKDDLFLACVQKVIEDLTSFVQKHLSEIENKDVSLSIRDFILLRQMYFDHHVQQKTIMETAMVKPPAHLKAQIHDLRKPLIEINHKFLKEQLKKIQLRKEIDEEKAIRYIETLDIFFQSILREFVSDSTQNMNTLIQGVNDLLDLFLFGITEQEL